MSNHIHRQAIPRFALVGAGIMIVSTIALASYAKQSREHAQAGTVVAAPLESIKVRFADHADGALAMVDDASGRELDTLAPGSNNFVRGVMRGMFRVRKLESKGHDEPFILSREANGRLALFDPSTGRRVDLDSFGPTNAASFSTLLTTGVTKLAAGETKP